MSAEIVKRSAPLPAMSWRWPIALVAVLLLHGAVLVLLQQDRTAQEPDTPAEAVLLDLAPAPAPTPVASLAPEPPVPAPPDPAVPALPIPVPPPAPMPISVKPEIVLPRPASPRPAVKPRPQAARPAPRPVTAAPAATAPAVAAPSPATPQAAQAAPAAPSNAAGLAIWASQLAAHLLRFRHYPQAAERRGMTGVVIMRFSVDPAGRIVAASMVRSSGHDIFDEEADAWLRRAQPLPEPPPNRVSPAQIVVPLSFVLN